MEGTHKTMAINKQTRDKIVSQSITELQMARTYKQGIIWRWWKSEDLFYGKKDGRYGDNTDSGRSNNALNKESRANVNIASIKAFAFVETYLSKLDSPLTFKYAKPTMADYKRAKLLNALKEQDSSEDDWDFKDLMGKTNAIIYGRAIFSYHANGMKGYKARLEVVDPYDFLIDPSGGGYDVDKAMFLGRYNIRKTKTQLERMKKTKNYVNSEIDRLLKGPGNDANQTTQEDINKQNKYAYIGSPGNRTFNDTNVFKMWEWYTTFEGARYRLLMIEEGAICIQCEKLTDLFHEDEELGDAMWPFWSYALMPNLTEFWVPSKLDYVRDIFLAQSVSINQMLDNGEAINKPQRAIDVSAIENLSDLVYRKNGVIRMKPGTDINKAFKIVTTPQIDTPIKVYQELETIQQLESGVTASAKGAADEDKVGIYEGNQANTADRYGVANKSYSNGYRRFAILYKNGIDDNLTVKKAVKILGPKGLEETVFVSRRDVKPQTDWNIIIESNNAEDQADATDKKNKMAFNASYRNDQIVNQKELFEKSAEIVGYSTDDIRRLLDISDYGSADMISEAERDMEELINKKYIEPNENADTAYGAHILSYMRDHMEDMDEETYLLFQDYMKRLQPIIVRNMGTRLVNEQARAGAMGAGEVDGAQVRAEAGVQPGAGGQNVQQLQNNEPR